MASQWNYLQNGQPLGPVEEEALKAMLASGALGWDVLVWSEGMATWVAAGQIPGLRTPLPAPMSPTPGPILLDRPEAKPSANPYATPRATVQGLPEGRRDSSEVMPPMVEALRQTKPWVRFLAVLGFIGTGFMVLGALAMLSLGSLRGNSALPASFGIGMMVAYLVMAGIQLPAVIFLNRYASRIGNLLDSHAPGDLTEALVAQKSFWRYMGILMITVLCFYVLAIVVAIGVGVASMAGRAH